MKTLQLRQWMKQVGYKMRTKGVLFRMMIGYVCIFLIVVMFNSCIYLYLRPILIEKEVTNTKNYLSYISERLDVQLLNVKGTMHKFLDNSQMIKGQKTEGGIGDINNQIALTKELIYFMTSCPVVSFAAVYNPSFPVVVTNEGTIDKKMLVERISASSGIPVEEVVTDIEKNRDFGYFPADAISDGDGQFTFYTGVSYSSNDFKMIAFVEKRALETILKNEDIEQYSKTYIVNESMDTLLSLSGDQVQKEAVSENGRYNGNTLVMSKSDFQDWTYLSILDDKRIVQNLGFIKNTFLVLISLMLLICIGISIKFVKSYYTPISNIIDRYLLTMKSGKNEFEAISETISALQDKSRQNEEKEVLSGILKSGFYSEDLDQLFEYSLFRVIAARAAGDAEIDENKLAQLDLDGDYVWKIIHEHHDSCSIILNGDELSYNKTMAMLLNLQQAYLEETGIFIAFGVSNICEQLMDIHEAYKDALMALKQGDSSNESCIYLYQDINPANQSMYMPVEFERKITECIYTRNHEEICNLIEDVFQQNYGIPNVYMHSVFTILGSIYTKLRDKIGNGEAISGDMINNEYRVKRVKEYLKRIYTSLEGDLIKENRIDAVRNYVTMYIRENYSDPTVSIEMVAEEMSLSSSYVSTLFKKATGIAFSQYLLQYRIDEGKSLLANTNEKISVVSEKAGFGTYNNFVRMFKKKVGVSPSQYRDDEHQKMRGER